MYVRVHIIMIKKIPNKQTINTHSNTKTHTKYTQKTNGKQQQKIPLKNFHVTVLIIIKSVKLYISPLSDTYVQ